MISEKQHFKQPISSDSRKISTSGFAVLTFVIILVCVYINSFSSSWQYDDYLNIVKNTNIRFQDFSWSSISKSFWGVNQHNSIISRPVSYFSFGVNYFLHAYRIWGYHLVNFLIHLIAAIFLYLFIKTVLRLPAAQGRYENSADDIALLAVFFWASHPIHVTAVTYVVQRMASMAGMFYIMSMYCFVRARTVSCRNKQIIYSGCCILTAFLAFGSKENAVMLPVSLFLLDSLVLRFPHKKRRKTYWITAALILLFVCLLSSYYVDWAKIPANFKNRPFTLGQRLLTEPRVIVFYLSLLFYPTTSRLTLLHDVQISTGWGHPLTTLPAILLLAGLLAGAFGWSRKRPFLSYCVVFFFLNHLVEGSVIALEPIYEHRNYLPSMLLFVPVAVLVIKTLAYFSYRKTLQMLVAFCTVVVLAAHAHTTYCYNQIFKNELIFWTDNVAKSPRLSVPHNNLGQALRTHGFVDRAKDEFRTAHRLDHYYNRWQKGIVLYNLGLHSAYEDNNYVEALQHLDQASQFLPAYADLFQHKALITLILGNTDDAARMLSQGLRLFPKKYGLIQALGVFYLIRKQSTEAFYWAARARQIHSDELLPLMIMAAACQHKEELNLAVSYWEKVMHLDPVHPLGAICLAALYDDMQNFQERNRYLGLLSFLKRNYTWNMYWQQIFDQDINRFFIPKRSKLNAMVGKENDT